MSVLLALFCLNLLFPLCLRRAGLRCPPSEDVTVHRMAGARTALCFTDSVSPSVLVLLLDWLNQTD